MIPVGITYGIHTSLVPVPLVLMYHLEFRMSISTGSMNGICTLAVEDADLVGAGTTKVLRLSVLSRRMDGCPCCPGTLSQARPLEVDIH